jgi:aerobic carbon-monoxide dehydrogenase medium subunit
MRRFDYFEPTTLQEAVSLLDRYGSAASVLAGGTDLLVEIKEQIRRPDYVINIKKIPSLDRLSFDERSGLRIGALVTVRQVESSGIVGERYPSLQHAAREIGSIQVRNRATVVGNICRASPSADTLPPLMAHAAKVTIFGPDGERVVPLEEFVTGPGRTVLAPHEIVTEVVVPTPAADVATVYIKHGRRKAMELATVGVAVSLARNEDLCRDVRIVLGAVAPTPIRARKAEALLRGERLKLAMVAAAAQAAMEESRPISNVRSSAEYRRDMVKVLVGRAIQQTAGWP